MFYRSTKVHDLFPYHWQAKSLKRHVNSLWNSVLKDLLLPTENVNNTQNRTFRYGIKCNVRSSKANISDSSPFQSFEGTAVSCLLLGTMISIIILINLIYIYLLMTRIFFMLILFITTGNNEPRRYLSGFVPINSLIMLRRV